MALGTDHKASCKLSHHVLGSIGHQQVGKHMVHEQSSGYVASVTLNILHDTSTCQGVRVLLGKWFFRGGGLGRGGGLQVALMRFFCLAGMHTLDDLPYGALAPGVMKKEKHPCRVGDY